MNYWEEIDGIDEDLATAPMGTSVVVQRHFPLARVVKGLNHLGYFKFDQGRRPRGAPDRLAMAAAGNDPDTVAAAMRLIDRLGFDAVNAGSFKLGLPAFPWVPAAKCDRAQVEFTAVEEDLADWCFNEPPSRLAAGHPPGLALTGA
jgi:predicted dinucleotide-binding enzyme